MLENNLSLSLSLVKPNYLKCGQWIWECEGAKIMTKRWMDRSHVYGTQNMCCIRRLKMSPFAVVAKWFAPSHFIRPFLYCHERTNCEHKLPIMVILFTYKVYGAFLCNGFFHLFQYIYIFFILFGAHFFSDSIQLRVGTHILLYFLQ